MLMRAGARIILFRAVAVEFDRCTDKPYSCTQYLGVAHASDNSSEADMSLSKTILRILEAKLRLSR